MTSVSIDFHYVRRKDDPLKIRAAGFTNFTGKFDTDVYEEVSAPGGFENLPSGWSQDVDRAKIDLLRDEFGKVASASDRGVLATLMVSLAELLENDNPDEAAAVEVIRTHTFPAGTDATKTAMQAVLA